VIFVFACVTFAWLLFKLPNFEEVILFIKTVYQNFYFEEINRRYGVFVLIYTIPVFLYHLYHYYNIKINSIIKDIVYGIMLFMIFFNSGMGGAFIYFQF